MYKVLSFLLLVVIACECKPTFYNQTNANEFIDGALEGVRTKYKAMLDPFSVPDETFEFHRRIIIDWRLAAKLTQGVITGLSNVKRSGDSTVGTEDGHLTTHVQLGDDDIHAHFQCEADLNGHKVDDLTIDTQIGIADIKTVIAIGDDGKPEVKELELDELKHIKLDIKGKVKPIDHLIDLLGDGFVEFFNPMARKLIQGVLKDAVNKVIKDMKFPPL